MGIKMVINYPRRFFAAIAGTAAVMHALTNLQPAASGIATVLASIPVGLSTAAAAALGTILGRSLCRHFQALSHPTSGYHRTRTCHTCVLLLTSIAMVSSYNLSGDVVKHLTHSSGIQSIKKPTTVVFQ